MPADRSAAGVDARTCVVGMSIAAAAGVAALPSPNTPGSFSLSAMFPPAGALPRRALSIDRLHSNRPVPTDSDLQERRIARERARDRSPARRRPRRPSTAGRTTPARRQRAPTGASSARLRSPMHATDDHAGVQFAGARAEQDQARLPAAPRASGVAGRSMKRGNIDDAVQVAADVGDAEEPRLGQRHRRR